MTAKTVKEQVRANLGRILGEIRQENLSEGAQVVEETEETQNDKG